MISTARMRIHPHAKKIRNPPKMVWAPKGWQCLIFGGRPKALGESVKDGMWTYCSIAHEDMFAFLINPKIEKEYIKCEDKLKFSIRGAFMCYRDACFVMDDSDANSFKPLKSIPNVVVEDGRMSIELIKNFVYPKISIVTPTYNRKKVFVLALLNYLKADYDKDLIEWIVVDDSDDPKHTITSYPDYIKCVRLTDRHYSIGEKRNIGVENASHDIVVFMDDDDVYLPQNLKIRVQSLLTNNGAELVGCNYLLHYSLKSETSGFASDGLRRVSEGTMCFYKRFWQQRPFEDTMRGEGVNFVKGREDKVITIPCFLVMIAVNHGENVTQLRDIKTKEEMMDKYKGDLDHLKYVDTETRDFLARLRDFI